MSDAEDAASQLTSFADSAMVVVTTAFERPGSEGTELAGALVGFHCQTSIEPFHYGVWLSKANHTCRVAMLADHLAVHFLSGTDLDVASHFGQLSGDSTDKFEGWDYSSGPGGVPVLERCPNRLVIERTAMVDTGGDHVLFSGPVVAADIDRPLTEPLRFGAASDLEPGHPAEDRPVPRTERAG